MWKKVYNFIFVQSKHNYFNSLLIFFKISSVKLEEGVTPTIIGRDFVIATLAAPTVVKEPEKPAEAETEEEAAAEDGKDAAAPAAEGDKKEGEEKKAPEEKK